MSTTEEIIEGEAVDVTPTDRTRSTGRELATTADRPVPAVAMESSLIVGGLVGLARMTDAEFESNLAQVAILRDRVDRVKAAIMKPGVDYGIIPGTDKPALLKPGAETLLRTFGLADSYELERTLGDGEYEPHLSIQAKARIHVGSTAGPVVATGVGAANTWETKHRYRGSNGRKCPDCGKETIIHSKAPRTGWWCGTRDGGCGHSFAEDDAQITGQDDPGKAENVDPYDLENTITKMAKKRALVDGILTATGTSGIFTQDEDAPGLRRAAQERATATQSGGTATRTPSGATTAPDGPAGLQGVVEKAPDGVRTVKVSSHGYNDAVKAKLEVVMKVQNRRHTVVLLGDQADAASMLGLAEGEVVRIIGGAVEEIIWQEGKPPKKELWGATDVAVLRDGAWILASQAVPHLPLEQKPSRPHEAASGPDDEPEVEIPGAAPAGPALGTWPEARADSDAVTIVVELTEPIAFVQNQGRKMATMKLADASAEIVNAVLKDEPEGEREAQLGTRDAPHFRAHDRVTVIGVWLKGWLWLTAIGKAVG